MKANVCRVSFFVRLESHDHLRVMSISCSRRSNASIPTIGFQNPGTMPDLN